jgi:hypothetical protein
MQLNLISNEYAWVEYHVAESVRTSKNPSFSAFTSLKLYGDTATYCTFTKVLLQPVNN